ncbi:MAG: hypothetical protein M3Y85_02950, partial [Bacteroidota bacterium]|nr:hypothetical protein [Bacteroidota bacterium]
NNKAQINDLSNVKSNEKQNGQSVDVSRTAIPNTDKLKQISTKPLPASEGFIPKQTLAVTIDSPVTSEIKKEELIQPLKADSSLKIKVALLNKKWRTQVNISAGGSYNSVTETPGALYNAASLQSPAFSGTYAPVKTSAGLGFSLGFSLYKKLTQKWEIAFGLQYAQYTTHTKVGDRKDNDTTVSYGMDKIAVSEFFTNTAKTNYANRFLVLELPVTISYRPSASLPMYFSVGVAYGRLLSTTALTFNNNSNLYYQNQDNYLRNCLPVSGSIQFVLRSKRTASIRIGPSIQYNLLKLRKENISTKPHLAFAGIKAGINF